QHWMIPGRSPVLQYTEVLVGILSGIGYDLEEVRCADVEGTGAGDENPSGAQHLQGAQVELLVTAQGFLEVALGLGEGRRIENDGVIAPVGSGVIPEEIEGVGLDPFQLPAVPCCIRLCV